MSALNYDYNSWIRAGYGPFSPAKFYQHEGVQENGDWFYWDTVYSASWVILVTEEDLAAPGGEAGVSGKYKCYTRRLFFCALSTDSDEGWLLPMFANDVLEMSKADIQMDCYCLDDVESTQLICLFM